MLANTLIRVLDERGAAIGPWQPLISPETLRAGLRHMMLTRAYDERMFRAQRHGKTSFYMKCSGEEAVAVAQAMAVDANGSTADPKTKREIRLTLASWSASEFALVYEENKSLPGQGSLKLCCLRKNELPIRSTPRKTVDIEVLEANGDWREVASTLRRTDFPIVPGLKPCNVFEMAFGTDRMVMLSQGGL